MDFADARVAPISTTRRHDATAQHPVQFFLTRGRALKVRRPISESVATGWLLLASDW